MVFLVMSGAVLDDEGYRLFIFGIGVNVFFGLDTTSVPGYLLYI